MRSAGWCRAWWATSSRWKRTRSRAGLLDHPHYTRPAEFRGHRVPDVLVSGHHGEIRRWRQREALRRTAERRPELLGDAPLNDEEREMLRELERLRTLRDEKKGSE